MVKAFALAVEWFCLGTQLADGSFNTVSTGKHLQLRYFSSFPCSGYTKTNIKQIIVLLDRKIKKITHVASMVTAFLPN
ncbi:hypothetical protein [Janthinobacterium sp. TND4EL3]|uniref:hypothetical protein n=1 Tax=Janthinobacterium sp. TND4EL3 TaxID=1907311 RepID=UPI001115AAC5|nr:hypothetical protein [Janthinobacterium sp. TND4EL3]